tara:strand:+ start:112 stop:402 length:291 start_codon:yes stop_codon:yes gene_type:complete
MPPKPLDIDEIKRIIRQISGKLEPEDGPLVVPCIISGKGHIWCYNPKDRDMIRILRGTKVFIVDSRIDPEGRVMIYAETGEIALIEQDELLVLGFN